MSPKLSQRLLDSFEEQFGEHFKNDFYKNGLTTNSTEKAKEISERFLNLNAQMAPFFTEMFIKSATKTTVPEEKQFFTSIGKQTNDTENTFLQTSKNSFGTVPEQLMSSPKPKFAVEYDKHLLDSLNSGLVPGSILPFMVAMVPGFILWYDLADKMGRYLLFENLVPLVAILTSDNQLNKIKAFIDGMDKQITPEVEQKLKEIFGKTLKHESNFYTFLYSGQDIDG